MTSVRVPNGGELMLSLRCATQAWVLLVYIGAPSDLLAAGAATESMLAAGRKAGGPRDSDNEWYSVGRYYVGHGGGEPRLQCRVLRKKRRETARRLPGYRQLMRALGQPARVRAR